MRTLCLALCLSFGVAAIAAAQDGQFQNPTPIDFTKPFLADGVYVRPNSILDDQALPVEVIGREELLRQGEPTIEELARELSKEGQAAGQSSINLRNLGQGRTLIMKDGRRVSEDPGKPTAPSDRAPATESPEKRN